MFLLLFSKNVYKIYSKHNHTTSKVVTLSNDECSGLYVCNCDGELYVPLVVTPHLAVGDLYGMNAPNGPLVDGRVTLYGIGEILDQMHGIGTDIFDPNSGLKSFYDHTEFADVIYPSPHSDGKKVKLRFASVSTNRQTLDAFEGIYSSEGCSIKFVLFEKVYLYTKDSTTLMMWLMYKMIHNI